MRATRAGRARPAAVAPPQRPQWGSTRRRCGPRGACRTPGWWPGGGGGWHKPARGAARPPSNARALRGRQPAPSSPPKRPQRWHGRGSVGPGHGGLPGRGQEQRGGAARRDGCARRQGPRRHRASGREAGDESEQRLWQGARPLLAAGCKPPQNRPHLHEQVSPSTASCTCTRRRPFTWQAAAACCCLRPARAGGRGRSRSRRACTRW